MPLRRRPETTRKMDKSLEEKHIPTLKISHTKN